MPPRSSRMCSHANCRTVVTEGRCRKHQAQAEARELQRQVEVDAKRPTSGERGYDADWRAVRRQFLAAYPKCVGFGQMVGMCRENSTEADHIISVAQAPELRLRWSNLRPYCKRCHSARTATEQSFGRGRPQ